LGVASSSNVTKKWTPRSGRSRARLNIYKGGVDTVPGGETRRALWEEEEGKIGDLSHRGGVLRKENHIRRMTAKKKEAKTKPHEIEKKARGGAGIQTNGEGKEEKDCTIDEENGGKMRLKRGELSLKGDGTRKVSSITVDKEEKRRLLSQLRSVCKEKPTSQQHNGIAQ